MAFCPNPKLNILVGNNETGKSTIVEALVLALTGRINGRSAQEELNPYWFNTAVVKAFFDARQSGKRPSAPEISIEVFFSDDDSLQRLHGAYNSEPVTTACPGVKLLVSPNPDYKNEMEAHFAGGSSIIPVEYYKIEWRTFGDDLIVTKPRGLTAAVINSRTIYSSAAVDYHLRQTLQDHLDADDKASVSLAYRKAKEDMTNIHLAGVNTKMSALQEAIDGQQISLAMDQSSRTSWEMHVVPHVAKLPLTMAGQGKQSSVKVGIALGRASSAAMFVMIEEPENHLSYTSLNKLIKTIGEGLADGQQAFVTTHSSFVLNRLGLDALQLVSGERVSQISGLSPETIGYFRKLPGYDTLRLAIADRVVLVEGPSDEIVFERFYFDRYGCRPLEDGIDVLSMRSLSLGKCLEVIAKLGKRCAACRDCDDLSPQQIKNDLAKWLEQGSREVFVGDPKLGKTLEPQIGTANSGTDLTKALGLKSDSDPVDWMIKHKTEAAIRIADADIILNAPPYMVEAMEFIHALA